MENLYPSLSERNYRQDFLRLAIRFLPEAQKLPAQKQQDFIHEHIPSLPDAQKLALIQRELWACFDECIDEAHKQARNSYATIYYLLYSTPYISGEPIISSDEDFEAFFYAYLQVIDNFSIESPLFVKYNLPTQDLQEILEVERYILKQKLENFYWNYRKDVWAILEQAEKVKGSFEEIIYEMPYLNLKFKIAYVQKSDKNRTLVMDIKATRRIKIHLVSPIPTGKFRDELALHLQDSQAIFSAQKQQIEAQYAIASLDLKNVVENYEKINKIAHTARVNFEIQFPMGKMQTMLDTRIYWNRNIITTILSMLSLFGVFASLSLFSKGDILGGISLFVSGLLFLLWFTWKTNRS